MGMRRIIIHHTKLHIGARVYCNCQKVCRLVAIFRSKKSIRVKMDCGKNYLVETT
jgi:hypothetical protein